MCIYVIYLTALLHLIFFKFTRNKEQIKQILAKKCIDVSKKETEYYLNVKHIAA